MGGRIERENILRKRINDKIGKLPRIFTEFYNYMEGDGKSYGTIGNYINYVIEFAEYITNDNIQDDFYKTATVANIRDYISSLRRIEKDGEEVKSGDSIQCTKYSGLSCFFKFLVMDEYIDINPMSKVKRPKMREEHSVVYLTDDEINLMLQSIEKEAPKVMINRDKCLVLLGLSTALRVAAITSIDVDDIDFTKMTIHVIEKENKERFVPFSNNLKNVLATWLLDRQLYFSDADTKALFVSRDHKRISVEGVRLLMKKYSKEIPKNITPHSLRKSAAMHMLENGIDIVTVSKMLNHASLETTKHYVDALDKNKEKAVEILDNFI